MENRYLFGKYEDDKKEKTMSFRVSKETSDLFERYSKSNYGDISKGLKEIFLDFLSQRAFRRQSLTKNVRMFVPKCKDEEEFEKHSDIPFNDFNVGSVPIPFDLMDLENVIVGERGIWDYTKLDLSNWINEQNYNDDSGWVSKKGYNICDGFVIEFPLNNQLDNEKHGIYCINDDRDEENNAHSGIAIVNYEDVVYYISFIFTIESKRTYPIDVSYPMLMTNEEAFEYAWECGNLELAKLIDGFNEGTSNIEHDKQMLLEKRENLIQQIGEIDDKLSKF